MNSFSRKKLCSWSYIHPAYFISWWDMFCKIKYNCLLIMHIPCRAKQFYRCVDNRQCAPKSNPFGIFKYCTWYSIHLMIIYIVTYPWIILYMVSSTFFTFSIIYFYFSREMILKSTHFTYFPGKVHMPCIIKQHAIPLGHVIITIVS